jgi:hypothetical protein
LLRLDHTPQPLSVKPVVTAMPKTPAQKPYI